MLWEGGMSSYDGWGSVKESTIEEEDNDDKMRWMIARVIID